MKKILVGFLLMISFNAHTSESMEDCAKKSIEQLASLYGSHAPLNIKTNWNNLKSDLTKIANEEVIHELLNDESANDIEFSLIIGQAYLMESSLNSSMKRYNVSIPFEVLNKEESLNETIFTLAREAESSKKYEVSCVEKDIKGRFGKKSKKPECIISKVLFK